MIQWTIGLINVRIVHFMWVAGNFKCGNTKNGDIENVKIKVKIENGSFYKKNH